MATRVRLLVVEPLPSLVCDWNGGGGIARGDQTGVRRDIRRRGE